MFPGVRSFLVFSSFGFKPPASGFSLILTVPSRFLNPYCTDDKASRSMEKRFSIVGDTQRGSQRYIKKRRGKKEIKVTRRRRGGNQKGRDQSSQ